MRQYIDLLTFSTECTEFGKKIGYDKVCFREINYVEPRNANELKIKQGKINVVRGGTIEINQIAVRKKGVNVLLDPVTAFGKSFDTAVAQVATDNNIAIAISLRSIINEKSLNRVKLIKNIINMIKICQKLNTEIIIVSGARNKYEMRDPETLASIGEFLGLSKPKQLWCVSEAPLGILNEIR